MKPDFKKQIFPAIIYSIGYLSGYRYGSVGYWVGSIIIYFLFGYFIAFVFWVLRGWKIGKVDNKKPDKFNWHNNKLK